MNLPPLDRRLALIAAMTGRGRPVADVGTDHGKLIAHLVATGQAPCGCATDIRPGPLSKARGLVEDLGLQDRIRLILCDGLAGVEDAMADEVVIAGMGGELIARIMEEWPYARQPQKHFLLQPMTRPEELRGWLWRSGYAIDAERCARQSGRVYSVISARWTGVPRTPDDLTCWLGGIGNFSGPDEAAYADKLLYLLEQKAAGLERSGQDASGWRRLMEQIGARTGRAPVPHAKEE